MRELNEVVLTESNFVNATNIQAYVKDCVNTALHDINSEHYKWPFLSASSSTEPHLGNAVVSTEEGVRWYLIKSDSLNSDGDYGYVDWDSFVITTKGVDGEESPYLVKNLKPITLTDWHKKYSQREARNLANQGLSGIPTHIIKNKDGRMLGLSPIPDKEYKIYFFAYTQMPKVTSFDDTFPFQEQYIPTLKARVRYYAWQFKENPNQSQLSLRDWNDGIRRMREQLLEEKPAKEFTDSRTRYI